MLSKYRVPTMQNRLGNLIRPPSKKSFFHQGFFAVKRRAVFVFDSIHNSATLHNLSSGIFHWTKKICGEVEWGVGAKKKGQSHDFPISLNTQLSIKQLF